MPDCTGVECRGIAGPKLGLPLLGRQRLGLSRTERRQQIVERTEHEFARADHEWNELVASKDFPPDEDMGDMEQALKVQALELQRAALEQMAQRRADKVPPQCPKCHNRLIKTELRSIEILSSFGPITITRIYGYCPVCERWMAPADILLGVDKEGKNSPGMRDRLRLLGTLVPPGQVEALSEHLFGFHVDDNRVARELERGGQEALEERKREDEKALSITERHEVTRQIRGELPQDPFTMVIEMDAWMVRERDGWGRSDEIRKTGGAPERWHEAKTATIFLTTDRGETASERPVILNRGFVSTREKALEFGSMVYAEAVRRGLLVADKAYVIADGAVWIWAIQKDRFSSAVGVLDRYHAAHHLHALAEAKFGKDSAEGRQWVQRLLHQLRGGGEAGVIEELSDLVEVIEELVPEQLSEEHKVIVREWNYFHEHREHLAYQKAAAEGVPGGSGAIESTCKQYQVRLKRCGQFWSRSNDEGLLALYSRWLSGKWPPRK